METKPKKKKAPAKSNVPAPATDSSNNWNQYNNYYNYGGGGYSAYPGYSHFGPPLPNTSIPPPGMVVPPPMSVPPPNLPPPPSGFKPTQPPPQPPINKQLGAANLDPMASLNANPSLEPTGPEPRPNPEDKPNLDPEDKPNVYSQQLRLELHRRMKNQEHLPLPTTGLNRNIINELDAFEDTDDEEDEDEVERGKGAEIAPPCDMNYYNSGDNKSTKTPLFRSHFDMADAFSAGLEAQKKKQGDSDSDS